MLLIIVALIAGLWLYSKSPRLEAADTGRSVHACVDGKRVESYVKEE